MEVGDVGHATRLVSIWGRFIWSNKGCDKHDINSRTRESIMASKGHRNNGSNKVSMLYLTIFRYFNVY